VQDSATIEITTRFLAKIVQQAPEGTVVIGGFAVQALVANEFNLATGQQYPFPPDISLFVPAERMRVMQSALEGLEVWKGAMPFRYTAVVDRDNLVTLSEDEAVQFPLHQLVYVDVNLFSDPEAPGAFHLPGTRKELRTRSLPVPFRGAAAAIPEPTLLLSMKCKAYVEREGEGRAIKDACDIMALVAYGAAVPGPAEREILKRLLVAGDESDLLAAELVGGKEALARLKSAAANP